MHNLTEKLQSKTERQCIHRESGTTGEYYRGDTYINSLQSVRGPIAFEIAQRVGPFFWADAPHMKVWLCSECAQTLSIS